MKDEAVRIISQTDAPVFALLAATNIDRVVTLYKAARRTRRIFLQDVYMATITTAAGENIPNPKGFSHIRVFLTAPTEKNHAILQTFEDRKIGRAQIAKERFVMCVRPSMRRYLEKLSEQVPFKGGVLLYSMWNGYRGSPNMEAFLQFMKDQGVAVVPLHTSGHADTGAIDALIQRIEPEYLLPIHTENAAWFERYEKCQVVYTPYFECGCSG